MCILQLFKIRHGFIPCLNRFLYVFELNVILQLILYYNYINFLISIHFGCAAAYILIASFSIFLILLYLIKYSKSLLVALCFKTSQASSAISVILQCSLKYLKSSLVALGFRIFQASSAIFVVFPYYIKYFKSLLVAIKKQ